MTITISGEFTTLNEYIRFERGNRYAGAKIKKQETERVVWEAKVQRLSAILDRADITCRWYVKNKRKDPDNIHFAIKFILDGLVKAGILYADSQEYIGKIAHTVEVDPANPRVQIDIVKSRGGEDK